jgi:hypothetical protein
MAAVEATTAEAAALITDAVVITVAAAVSMVEAAAVITVAVVITVAAASMAVAAAQAHAVIKAASTRAAADTEVPDAVDGNRNATTKIVMIGTAVGTANAITNRTAVTVKVLE